jgi:TM2 domain-containing membrane protein YozV
MKGNMMDDFGWILTVFFVLLGCAVVAAIFLLNKSKEQSRQSDENIARMVNALPEDKRTPFLMQLTTVKKNPTTAVLLALFLGGVGAHKFYLGQTGLGIVYLLFSWTTIPGWIALIEAFSLSGKTAQYNEKKAQEFYQMYTGTYPVR